MTAGLSGRGFDLDLLAGQAREAEFTQIVCSARVEHKDDKIARRTGNFFLEYSQPSGPSGIATTEADFWCIRFDDDAWIFIRTSVLKALGRRAIAEGRLKNGGDYNRYKGVLVPLDWMVRPSMFMSGAP